MKNYNLFKDLEIILADAKKEDESDKEIDELVGDIKLIIHEFIDNVDSYSKDKANELILDLSKRLNIETSGHKLDKNKLKEKIKYLVINIFDIYNQKNNGEIIPRGTEDVFKYALTFYLVKHLDKISKETLLEKYNLDK